MNIIERAMYWVFNLKWGPRFKADTIADLQEERGWYASEIKRLKDRKKKHSHLLPGFQHVTSEILRMEIGK